MVSIVAFQAVDPGSIPGHRTFFCIFFFFLVKHFFIFLKTIFEHFNTFINK